MVSKQALLALDDILDRVPCAVVVRDSDGRLVSVNGRYQEILGTPAEDTLKTPDDLSLARFTDTEGKPLAAADWPATAVLAGRIVRDLNLSLVRPDGRRVWLQIDATKLDDPTLGTLSVTTFMDVTGRHEAESTARAASDRATQMLSVLHSRHRQQEGIAELGRLALVGSSPQQLMDHAVALVASTLDADFVRILELLPDGKSLALRAGTGWRPGLVGSVTISLENTPAGYLFESNEPLLFEDFRTETRFPISSFLREHGAVSGIRAVIRGEPAPFGELAAFSKQPGQFTQDDIFFVTALANTLADAFIRLRAEQTREQTLLSLQVVDETRQRLLERLSRVVEEERRRIGSDIHDDALQVLAGLGIRIQLMAERVDDPGHKQSLGDISAALGEAGRRLRRLVFDLRPDALELGLGPALRFYFEQTATGVDPELSIDSKLEAELPAETGLMIYRACQEAINNVRKHARASRVTISVRDNQGGVEVIIADDGVGFDVQARVPLGHIGLVEMRERIQLAGGRFTVTSEPSRGTTVQVWVPGPPLS